MSFCTSSNKELSMAIRKNLKEYEPKFEEECKKLEAATGFPVTFEFQATPEDLKKAYRGFDERAGFFAHAHLAGSVAALVDELKDDMVKEGFAEALTQKKIVLVPDASVSGYNAIWAFKDGVLRIQYKAENFGNNCDASYVKGVNKLEKLL